MVNSVDDNVGDDSDDTCDADDFDSTNDDGYVVVYTIGLRDDADDGGTDVTVDGNVAQMPVMVVVVH